MNVLALMRRFTIRFRMQSAIAVVLLLLGLLGGVGMWSMLRIYDLHHDFIQGPWGQNQQLQQLQGRFNAIELDEKEILITFSKGGILDTPYADWTSRVRSFQEALTQYQQGMDGLQQQDAEKLAQSMQAYVAGFAPLVESLQANPYVSVEQTFEDALKPHQHLLVAQQDMQRLQTLLQQQAQALQQGGDAVTQQAKWLFLASVLLALLIVGPLTWLNMLAICRPLGQAQKLAKAIAQGDLTQQLDSRGKDEIADLQRDLQDMQNNLGQMVGQVQAASSSIALASQEIASGNADLSSRTEQTASNLQQTVASLEQLTGTVQQTAVSAGQANQLAASAAQTAGQGGVVVQDAVTSMQEIANSSRRIGDIIGLIDSIAFQTNILALNAAVEAARAGEQGRGFAVVAGEVRSLAHRSAEAANEIKKLIGSSVAAVDGGVRNAQDAGTTMEGIVSGIERVVSIIRDITSTANEQSTGIAEVNQAVGQIDQMTQQNAALVEQSAAAAQSLNDQAQRLAQVVGQFKLAAGAVSPGRQTSHYLLG